MNTALILSGRSTRLRRRSRASRRWAVLPLSLGVFFALLALTPLDAADEKLADFKAAIVAQDQKNWTESIEILRRILPQQPETGERVRMYGTRYVSYLPHYYLGLALFGQGDCTSAMREWEQSLRIECVQNAPECEALLKHQKDCRQRPY